MFVCVFLQFIMFIFCVSLLVFGMSCVYFRSPVFLCAISFFSPPSDRSIFCRAASLTSVSGIWLLSAVSNFLIIPQHTYTAASHPLRRSYVFVSLPWFFFVAFVLFLFCFLFLFCVFGVKSTLGFCILVSFLCFFGAMSAL